MNLKVFSESFLMDVFFFLLQTESHDRHKGKFAIIYYFFNFRCKYSEYQG